MSSKAIFWIIMLAGIGYVAIQAHQTYTELGGSFTTGKAGTNPGAVGGTALGPL